MKRQAGETLAEWTKRKTVSLLLPHAYRVRTSRGTLVLCYAHVEKLRRDTEPEAVKFTGEKFVVELCDHCHPENT